jgi:hypothetical protein
MEAERIARSNGSAASVVRGFEKLSTIFLPATLRFAELPFLRLRSKKRRSGAKAWQRPGFEAPSFFER